MAEGLVNDPRKKLYSALVSSPDKDLAGQVKKFSYNKFNSLLDNNDFVQDLFMDISERGVILDAKNPKSSQDPNEFISAFVQKELPPAPKQQAAPVQQFPVGIAAPGAIKGAAPSMTDMTRQMAFQPPVQEPVEPVGVMAPPAVQEPIPSITETAREMAFKPPVQPQMPKEEEERGFGEWAGDVAGTIAAGGKRIGEGILSSLEYYVNGTLRAGLPEIEATQSVQDIARNEMFKNATQSQKQFQDEAAKRNIETSVLQAIDKGQYKDIPEAVLYTVGDAAMQIIPSILTMGGSTYLQTLPQAYKDGVEAIAKEKGISPEQVIANGDDAMIIATISSGVQSALEFLGAGLVSKSIASRGAYKAMRDWLLRQGVNRNLARGLGLLGVGMGEGFTEYSQEGTGQIGVIAAKSPTTKAFFEKLPKELFTPQAKRQREEAFVGGLIGGPGVGGAGQVVQSAMDRTLFEAPKIGKATQRPDMDIVLTDDKIRQRNSLNKAMESAIQANPEAEGQIRERYRKLNDALELTDDEVLAAYDGIAQLPPSPEKDRMWQNLEVYMAEKGIQPQATGMEAGLGEGLRTTSPVIQTVNPDFPAPQSPVTEESIVEEEATVAPLTEEELAQIEETELTPEEEAALLAEEEAAPAPAEEEVVSAAPAEEENVIVEPGSELFQKILDNGEQVVSRLDAEKRIGDGEKLFGFNEQDDSLIELSLENLGAFTIDTIIAVRPEAIEEAPVPVAEEVPAPATQAEEVVAAAPAEEVAPEVVPAEPATETPQAGSVGVGGDEKFTAKGGNKVVDEKGEPLVVYRSTYSENNLNDGVNYFAEDANYSKEIAAIMNRNGKASNYVEERPIRTIPVNISASRVYELPKGEEMNGNKIKNLLEKDPDFTKKYDAVKGIDLYSDNKIVYAVFDKANIKELKSEQPLKETPKAVVAAAPAPKGRKKAAPVTPAPAAPETKTEVEYTQEEDDKLKAISIEANFNYGNYIKNVPSGRKNKFANDIYKYEATNPFTGEKVVFNKKSDAADYVIEQITVGGTKKGREGIFRRIQELNRPEPQPVAETKEGKKAEAKEEDKGKVATKVEEYEGVFNPDKTGVIGIDELLEDDGYQFFYKGKKVERVLMSPDEYLERVRKGLKTKTDANILEGKTEAIKKAIESGAKINAPFISTVGGKFSQEGRNRAVVAKELGEQNIPVFIESDVTFDDKINRGTDLVKQSQDKGNKTKEDVLEDIKKSGLHRDGVRFIEENYDAIQEQIGGKPSTPEFTSSQSSEAATAFDKAKTSKGFDKKHGKGAYKALSDITKNFDAIMDNLSDKIKQDCL